MNEIPEKKKLSKKQRNNLRRETLRQHALTFRKEFNQQMLIFITGAFSFMAALVWNTAIQEIITNYKTEIFGFLPIRNQYLVDLLFAFIVTIIAVIAIIIISRLLKTE